MVMRHLLGLLLAALLVSGCGDDTTGQAEDDPPATESSGQVEPSDVVFVSESAVGGNVLTTATTIDSDRAIAKFSEQFDDERMGEALQTEADKIEVPDGDALVAAVVALACDAPTEVSVERTPAGLQVSSPSVKTDKQCLVPVTTVALVTVPQSAL
jgi:hypothetical protein